ncbi:hypothetical protein KUA55_17370 [Enterococcus sp. ALS3]|uniref:Uncharacterized protein n=1 Tax=Enterococcus alishanensis TaxID=1303817 RepID=A0ABS6TI10_9ENTE|nr:hypothetical protein [Enterococcus alishanensis]
MRRIIIYFYKITYFYLSYRGTIGPIGKNRLHRHFYTSVCHQKITIDTTEFKYFETDNKGNILKKITI